MSVLCVLSDMTPGSSCGGWNVLVEGVCTTIKQRQLRYRAAVVCVVWNHNSRKKFSAHPDEHFLFSGAFGVSSWLHLGPAVRKATCELRRWFCTGKHDLWHSFVDDWRGRQMQRDWWGGRSERNCSRLDKVKL